MSRLVLESTTRALLGLCLAAGIACDAPPPAAEPEPEAAAPPVAIEAGEFETAPSIGDIGNHWLAEGEVGRGAGPVSQAMLNDPFAETDRWLHYYGNYAGHRHSPLQSLNPRSVPELEVAWTLASGTVGQFEVSPIVYDGIIYVTTSYNRIFALDAVSGDILWRYDHQQPEDIRLCCGPPNRGPAIAGDLILMGTLDAKLIAFNRRSGKIVWTATVATYSDGFSLTSAPLIVRNLAIVGIAGGEYGVRGYFDAYDVKTGERLWRHYTVPAAGEEGAETWAGNSNETGGAPAWTTGAYDPSTDTLYWTTGNPSPDWNGDLREGDNLYSNTILAVDPATGKRKWHFQTTPHDVWDYDGNTQLFLFDVGDEQYLAQPNRNGFFYFLNRPDGVFKRAAPYVEQINWATVDATGRPVVNPKAWPVEEPTERICPSNMGGINGAFTAAYNPDLELAFVPSIEACQRFAKGAVVFTKGLPYLGGLPETVDADEGKTYGLLSAIDVKTGEAVWRYRDRWPMMGGTLSTAGGVVFTGNLTGDALAFDAKTGEELWRFRTGGGIRSQPIAYEIDGTTYVAIASGSWATIDAFSGGPSKIPEGGHFFVFRLPAE